MSSNTSNTNSEEETLIDYAAEVAVNLANTLSEQVEGEGSNAIRRNRRYIKRGRDQGQNRLMEDYFNDNAIYQVYFRRRFRMHKPLFFRIVEGVCSVCDSFTQRPDARGTLGFTPIQKYTAALRMLAYGTHPDSLDENFRMSERTARDTLIHFCDSILQLYGPRYLRYPTPNDVKQLYDHHANVHGFPGMLGSLDCMHWKWNMCKNHLRGQYTKGLYNYPTVVLEAVASQDLWFWHANFGSPGSLNDINILDHSPLFNKMLDGTGPDTSFVCRGVQFQFGYYLVDGIYPERSVFVKPLTNTSDPMKERYKVAQSKARKDIERAFGALKKRFQIVSKPSYFREVETMQKIMYTCMTLHNMILEDEDHAICQYDPNEVIPETQAFPMGSPMYRQITRTLHNAAIYNMLRSTLTEHLWSLRNLDLNMPPEDELAGQYSDEDPLL